MNSLERHAADRERDEMERPMPIDVAIIWVIAIVSFVALGCAWIDGWRP